MTPRLWLAWLAVTSAAFLFLGGCALIPHRPPQPTVVPIAVPCVPASVAPAPSSYADDNLPTGPAHIVDRYRLGASANEARKARLAIIEPVISACR